MRYRKISDAFYNSASVIKFYKDKAEAAAEFPTEISAVAEWAEREYGEYIEISSRAKSELKNIREVWTFPPFATAYIFSAVTLNSKQAG